MYYIFINHIFFTKKSIELLWFHAKIFNEGHFKNNNGWLNKGINLKKERQFTTRLSNYFR